MTPQRAGYAAWTPARRRDRDATIYSRKSARVDVKQTEVLADDWGVLTKYWIDYTRADGTTPALTRETYDRGHGAVILLYNKERRTVLR